MGMTLRYALASRLVPNMFSAVYVPEDDRADSVPATTFIHLDANTVLSRHESLYLGYGIHVPRRYEVWSPSGLST